VEIWDPYQGTVQLLLDIHPEEKSNSGLGQAQLIPINGTATLIETCNLPIVPV
jgi:hypothetical protein